MTDPYSPGSSTAAGEVHTPARRASDDRSIGELLGDVTRDLSTLMRQEVALAKAELQQSAKRAGTGAGLLTGAGVAAIFVLSFLSLALWWGLGRAIGDDLPALGISGLIVAVIWLIIAVVLALVGRSQLSKVPGVDRTTETVQQIPNALKGHEEENR